MMMLFDGWTGRCYRMVIRTGLSQNPTMEDLEEMEKIVS